MNRALKHMSVLRRNRRKGQGAVYPDKPQKQRMRVRPELSCLSLNLDLGQASSFPVTQDVMSAH